jgi:TonB family protein
MLTSTLERQKYLIQLLQPLSLFIKLSQGIFCFFPVDCPILRSMKGLSRQTSQKILILAAVVSVGGHLLMLSIAGLIGPGHDSIGLPTFTVELRESSERPENAEPLQAHQQPATTTNENTAYPQASREEVVDLGNRDGQYVPYVKKIKEKIDKLWAYPKQAYDRRETGIVVLSFSIRSNGRLEKKGILESSGFAALDRSALDVVSAAAPFSSFPADMKLARLHIVATFKYRIDE